MAKSEIFKIQRPFIGTQFLIYNKDRSIEQFLPKTKELNEWVGVGVFIVITVIQIALAVMHMNGLKVKQLDAGINYQVELKRILRRRQTMSRTKQNDCVMCDIPCVHCERGKDYVLVRCDWCGQNVIDEEHFEEAEWHQIKIKGRYGSGPYIQDMCPKCHEEIFEALVNFRSEFEAFKKEVKIFSREAISEAEHEKYISTMDEWLDTLGSCLDGD